MAGRQVRRKGSGAIEVRIGTKERAVLRSVLGQFRAMLEADAADPALKRLFPTAYAEDPEKEEGYQALARHELLDARLTALAEVEASLDARTLGPDEAAAWLRSLNALRLVVGTRLDIRDDEDPDIDEHTPDLALWALYRFLSGLVDDLVHAL